MKQEKMVKVRIPKKALDRLKRALPAKKWKSRRLLPYIEDMEMWKAVQFALVLKKKMSIALAIHKAAEYYSVDRSEVARYIGELGSEVKKIRNERKMA